MKNYATIFAMAAMSLAVAHGGVITYVDADTSNTLEWDGSDFSTWNPGTSAADGEWRTRSVFANEGTIYESSTTDTTRLKTSVSGLDSGVYNVYAYMWAASEPANNWGMGAALADEPSELPLFWQVDYPANAALSMPYVEFGAGSEGDFTSVAVAYSDAGATNPFTSAVMVAESDRRLVGIYLGQVSGTEISVFIDDNATAVSGSNRTWYDGIGYEAVPEPATLGLIAIFGGALVCIRRRFMI